MATAPAYASIVNTQATKFISSDGTNAQTIFSAGTSGSRVGSIILSSDAASGHYVTFSINQGGSSYVLGTSFVESHIPGGRSHAHTNVLDPSEWTWLDANNIAIFLTASMTLELSLDTALGAGEILYVVVMGGDF